MPSVNSGKQTSRLATRLYLLFAQSGFCLLGAYVPGILAWFFLNERAINAVPASLIRLALIEALAVAAGGGAGMTWLILWRRRSDGVITLPTLVFAALGYFLAISTLI